MVIAERSRHGCSSDRAGRARGRSLAGAGMTGAAPGKLLPPDSSDFGSTETPGHLPDLGWDERVYECAIVSCPRGRRMRRNTASWLGRDARRCSELLIWLSPEGRETCGCARGSRTGVWSRFACGVRAAATRDACVAVAVGCGCQPATATCVGRLAGLASTLYIYYYII